MRSMLTRCGCCATIDWPGNVRQLENAIFRAVVLAESDTLGVDEFPQIAMQTKVCETQPAEATDDASALTIEAPLHFVDEAPPLKAELSAAAAGAMGSMLALLDAQGEPRPLADLEAEAIRFALSHCRGRMAEVARRLGIGRSTLYRKLEALGLGAPDAEAETETGSLAGG